ncbi:WBP2-like protein [Mya arenaria]|uniref:WBP2-like protein n=1 Tax=Mya arenaria TaxID=6604 RepID=A0ABY7DIH0_MYAAR|nr:WBP2-like protein [Mya arenaria]
MSINTAHANGGVLIFTGERILLYCDNVEMGFEPNTVIFCNKNKKDMLQSFSLPFLQMRGVELEQPVFGANYIKGKMLDEAGASRNRPAQPPPYSPPQGPFYQAPPPAYSAPHTEYYAWVPYQTFPTAPPPEYVYTTGAPPPYPGVDPAYPPPQPVANGTSSADAKAMEAAASGYYNPANPHNVYTPAPYPSAPPSYDDVTKKNQ